MAAKASKALLLRDNSKELQPRAVIKVTLVPLVPDRVPAPRLGCLEVMMAPMKVGKVQLEIWEIALLAVKVDLEARVLQF
jgi:hypothetical protein